MPKPLFFSSHSKRGRQHLSFETLEARRVLAAYINEFHFSPLFGNNDQHQYLELRGESNASLPTGTYFIGIESADGVNELGDLHTIIDLSNQAFGSNGMLVLLQSGAGFAVNPQARVLQGTNGFLGMPGGIYQADGNAKSIHAGSSTYLLVHSDIAPTLANDIDANDDGLPDGAYANWTILDGFSVLPAVESPFNQRSFGPIVFREKGIGDGFLPGSTLVDTEQLAYVGRIAQSTGFSAKDWLAANTVESSTMPWQFQLQHGVFGTPRPFAYAGRFLDHLGSQNWHGSISGSVFEDLNADGIQQVGESSIHGVTVQASLDGAVEGTTFETIEPDNYLVNADLSNASRNVTLISAGADNAHQSFKVRAVQKPSSPTGQHIFAHEGVGFFNEDRRLRMDFYRPARSISINVIGDSDLSATYGRLEIFSQSGLSLGFVRSNPLGRDVVQTLSISSANDDIAWAVAYSESSYLNSSPFGKLDNLRIEVLKTSAVSTDGGNFSLSPLNAGNFIISSQAPDNFYLVQPLAGSYSLALAQNQAARGFNFGFQSKKAPSLDNQSVSVGELIPANGLVATLPVKLGYPTQTLDIEIVSGDLNHLFVIDPTSFELRATKGDLDFESLPSYTLEVRLQDRVIGGFTHSATVQVNLTNENDAPLVQAQVVSISENATVGTFLTKMTGSDQDSGPAGQLQWSISGGNSGSAFSIDPNTGDVSVANSGPIDFESNPVFQLMVQATDGGSPAKSNTAILKVNLLDLNEAPVILPQAFAVDENNPAGTFVGQLHAQDPDAGQSLTWSLFGGTGQQNFRVSSEGKITVAEGVILDFETQASYVLQVQANDSGSPSLFDSRSVTIAVTDRNDPPTLASQSFFLPENSAVNTVVGTVHGQDMDAGQTLSYSITGGTGASMFSIHSSTGVVSVALASLDFETTPQISFQVTVTDSADPSAASSASMLVQLTNVNETPRITARSYTVPENSLAGTKIATLEASDVDAGDQLVFELLDQTLNWLRIDTATGDMFVATGADINFEAQPQIVATVRVADLAGLAAQATITIVATNVNDAPRLVQSLPDASVQVGDVFSYTIPEASFADEDVHDSLQFFVTTSAGFSLPSWLKFDSLTRTLSGTPSADDLGTLSLRVRALDTGGASVADLVDIVVHEIPHPWHNAARVHDVSNDKFVTPIDALMVINYLNAGHGAGVPKNSLPTFGYLDVNGDNFVTPIDALMVINRLNSGQEGEAELFAANAPSFYNSRELVDRDELDELLELLASQPSLQDRVSAE